MLISESGADPQATQATLLGGGAVKDLPDGVEEKKERKKRERYYLDQFTSYRILNMHQLISKIILIATT